ncbi:MAG: alpha/beta hydrolase [Acidobacteriota bacterium]|nr:alpha/beta hydrolase [Acidobacteriota bacterium]
MYAPSISTITGAVTSNDGTAIGYSKFGEGPSLVLLHGSLSSSQHLMELGRALADGFTVYIPDRRGRGTSGPIGSGYCLEREVEDLTAMLFKSQARIAFGVGTGGLILLQALMVYSGLRKIALYEPPLDVDGSLIETLAPVMRRYEKELAKGQMAEALTTVMKGWGMLPNTIVGKLPRFLLERSFKQAMAQEKEEFTPSETALESLIPMQSYDYKLMVESKGTLESYRIAHAEVLLLGGSKTPAMLKNTLDKLENVIPHARRIELKGMGHTGPAGHDGEPDKVAAVLREFFGPRTM